MNYEKFKHDIVEVLEQCYPKEEYEINLRSITKNNGIRLDGLCIFKKGDFISPTIYLNYYYERYVAGSILTDIAGALIQEYERGMKLRPHIGNVDAYYEAVQSQIVMRLVNYEKNKEILEDCPYIPFHDLAITFRWLAHWDEIGISTALITNHEMEQWGVNTDTLYEDAMENTKRIFPSKIQRLRDMVDLDKLPADSTEYDLYVLTNAHGINGATSVLYDHVLKEFGKEYGTSFYLLPSSIHEMMLCPAAPQISQDMLLALVRDANHMVVTMGEVLSDNIYYYDYETEELSMIENLDSAFS